MFFIHFVVDWSYHWVILLMELYCSTCILAFPIILLENVFIICYITVRISGTLQLIVHDVLMVFIHQIVSATTSTLFGFILCWRSYSLWCNTQGFRELVQGRMFSHHLFNQKPIIAYTHLTTKATHINIQKA